LIDAAKEFPGKAKDAAQGAAGLGFCDAIAAVKHTISNTAALNKLPDVVKQTAEQAKISAEEIREAAHFLLQTASA